MGDLLFSGFMRPPSDVAFGGVRLWYFARKALFFLRFLPWSVDGRGRLSDASDSSYADAFDSAWDSSL